MELSKHAVDRIRQRGISMTALDVIWKYGRESFAPGGAVKYFFGRNEYQYALNDHEERVDILDRVKGCTVVVIDGTVITVYRWWKIMTLVFSEVLYQDTGRKHRPKWCQKKIGRTCFETDWWFKIKKAAGRWLVDSPMVQWIREIKIQHSQPNDERKRTFYYEPLWTRLKIINEANDPASLADWFSAI
jgi:hypothetical protein